MVVGVDEMRAGVAVTGEVDLSDTIPRQAREVFGRREAVVHGAHVDVVHVEQDAAVGGLGDGAEEGPLGHRRVAEGQVARHVLDQYPPAEPVLNPTDALRDVGQRLVRVWQRQQVMGVVTSEGAPAQVLRDPGRLEAVGQLRELVQVAVVQRVGTAEVHRDAVQDDGCQRARLLEHVERAPAADHEVLRDHLEPVDARGAVEDTRVMRRAEPDAVAEVGQQRHEGYSGPGGTASSLGPPSARPSSGT